MPASHGILPPRRHHTRPGGQTGRNVRAPCANGGRTSGTLGTPRLYIEKGIFVVFLKEDDNENLRTQLSRLSQAYALSKLIYVTTRRPRPVWSIEANGGIWTPNGLRRCILADSWRLATTCNYLYLLWDGVVARDGIAQHYTGLTIPLTGICLDPALELR